MIDRILIELCLKELTTQTNPKKIKKIRQIMRKSINNLLLKKI